MEELAKVGDIIEWTFSNDPGWIGTIYEQYMGKTFQSKVMYISTDDGFSSNDILEYGVYTDYGQDYIPHDQCKIIKGKEDGNKV
ncbi:MAG: hypothetical protein M0R17_04740 [Candidatus Omnitrophica bacterium]|jgi:hypothetical protein|nr:hypothetical protein [Candidatus Omnitrophota bacterium]